MTRSWVLARIFLDWKLAGICISSRGRRSGSPESTPPRCFLRHLRRYGWFTPGLSRIFQEQAEALGRTTRRHGGLSIRPISVSPAKAAPAAPTTLGVQGPQATREHEQPFRFGRPTTITLVGTILRLPVPRVTAQFGDSLVPVWQAPISARRINFRLRAPRVREDLVAVKAGPGAFFRLHRMAFQAMMAMQCPRRRRRAPTE
jgi:hypothetical protein